jgi:hypothetical protein
LSTTLPPAALPLPLVKGFRPSRTFKAPLCSSAAATLREKDLNGSKAKAVEPAEEEEEDDDDDEDDDEEDAEGGAGRSS